MTTRDEILTMAREAGFSEDEMFVSCWPFDEAALKPRMEKFFRLAQAVVYERAITDCAAFIAELRNYPKYIKTKAAIAAVETMARRLNALKEQACPTSESSK